MIIMHSWQAALLVGGPGTGKTTIINQYLSSFPEQDMGSKTITFSSLTTPAIFQTFIEVLSIHTLAWHLKFWYVQTLISCNALLSRKQPQRHLRYTWTTPHGSNLKGSPAISMQDSCRIPKMSVSSYYLILNNPINHNSSLGQCRDAWENAKGAHMDPLGAKS